MKKNIQWLLPVLICLAASVVSLFLPVLIYEYPNGQTATFNVLSFVSPDELSSILLTYSGSVFFQVDPVVAVILAAAAVLSIVAAFVGVITMSRQRPNTWQFVLALAGMIGTAIPSVLVFLAVILSKNYFPGTFRFGVYPIITPIAMVLCMITVTRKHRKTQAELRAAELAKGLICRGGDL